MLDVSSESTYFHLQSIWTAFGLLSKKHVEEVMGVPESEKCFFDTWDQDALDEIFCTQRAVVKHQKAEKVSKLLYSIAVVVDDKNWCSLEAVASSIKGSVCRGGSCGGS